MKFSWDPRKARANERRHRVSFEEARSVFGDPLAITYADVDHSIGELRSLSFGESLRGRLLVVAHVELEGGTIRIISARIATRGERCKYEEA